MEVKLFQENGVAVFQVTGEINIATSPDLLKAFEKQSATKIVVDLEKVSYVDSSGLATLVEMLKKVRAGSCTFGLAGMSDKIRSLFEITKLDKFFSVYPNRAKAVSALS